MPYEFQDSKFDDFESDFDKVNWIDTKTWTKKKVYDNNYWLVIPNQRFNFKMGNTLPPLTVFLRKPGEQFGDAITPLNIADMTVLFKCYDYNNQLIIQDIATITNELAGQVEYEFKALDFNQSGHYYAEFIFTIDDKSFTLPDTKSRIEIIVID